MEKNIRPPFSSEDARDILARHYNIRVRTSRALPSELDRNYFLESATGKRYVLKVSHLSVSDEILDLQNAALEHLAQSMDLFSKVIRANDGRATIAVTSTSGVQYRARVLTYIQGISLREFRPHSPRLLANIGTRLGELSTALQGFDHSEKRLDYRWNIRNLLEIALYAQDLPQRRKEIFDSFLAHYQRELIPELSELRHSFVYNDPNDTNILIHARGFQSAYVAGMIDFGDMVYSPAVTDLAVALAYIMMNTARPLERAMPVIRAYHEVFPLTDTEMRLLFTLIIARLCLSVSLSWHQQKEEPDNPHLSISESGAWRLLETLHAISPRYAHYLIRSACGLPAHPQARALANLIEKLSIKPILGYLLTEANSIALDLGMGSRLLAKVADLADPAAYAIPFNNHLNGQIGIGRYNEVRPTYLHDQFALSHNELRCIHLGIDLFVPSGTPIYAPLEGTVYSLQECDLEQGNHPTLILKHQPRADLSFYTLYSHLSPGSLDHWQVGQQVQAGTLLANIGNSNGSPHLHFQIVLDLLDSGDNFPGVCAPELRSSWTTLSPSPNLILRLPFEIEASHKRTRTELLRKRQAYLNPALSLAYEQPLKIERAHLHYLFDENGQPYLDCVNNVPHVGHSHPRVVAVAQDQMAILNTNTRYLHDSIVEYAETLIATLPEPLSVCFFVNSGSEANELALRLAKAYTGGSDLIVIDHAYHGHTTALIDISPYKFNGYGGQGKPDHVEVARMPDGYRGECRGFDSNAGQHYACSVAEQIQKIRGRNKRLAAMFFEGIMGCGGQMPLPVDYLKSVFALVHEAGGICIADEVQTGFGRVGSHFWAFELSGVVPDIVTVGKPIANGHPLGAVVTTPAIAAAFNNGMEYFNTFGGNPVSCTIGLEVLKIIVEDRLQHNALETGTYWMNRLRALPEKHSIIGQVRGSGLFLGIELIRDLNTLEPAAPEANYVVERMKQLGILVSTEGPHHNVLKLKPPIIFGRKHVDIFMSAFDEVLQDTVLQGGKAISVGI